LVKAEQLPLVPERPARPSRTRAQVPAATAAHLPIAKIRIDSNLPHLDRDFDYSVPESMADAAQPGTRVRVRFAGRLVAGLIMERTAEADIDGALRPIDRLVSPERIVTEETRALIEAVADRYAGTFSDVLRLAVPSRHARAEAALTPDAPAFDATTLQGIDPESSGWGDLEGGRAFLESVSSGEQRRGVWSMPPARDWEAMVAAAVRAVLARSTGGVLIVVPDAADTERLISQFQDVREITAVLRADHGPERRYREFLRVLRGHARLVIGTRTAVFAPVADLALTIVWNDGEDTLWEPHAPYWNARDVAALRAHLAGTSLLLGSPARSVEAQALVERGWAIGLEPTRSVIRERGPVVRAVEPTDIARDEAAASARIPHIAWLVAKEGLRSGPVLVQVGRRGYLGVLACQRCRELAQCSFCAGPLAIKGRGGLPTCSWCAQSASAWTCPDCGNATLRSLAIGAERTAEEIGRAFPGTAVIWSTGEQSRREVGPEPAIVVATPGAEPVCSAGYAAVVLLDANAALARPGMRGQEDAVARWFSAALLAAPKAHVVVAAPNPLPAVQALIRWDAAWFASRELADRTSASLPPESRIAILRGTPAATAEVLRMLHLPHRALGPVEDRTIVVVDRSDAAQLSRRLRAISSTRAAQRSGEPVTVRMDPREP
jgi:primosomal protein N' (replication factor Y) (superfamily II helicase)